MPPEGCHGSDALSHRASPGRCTRAFLPGSSRATARCGSIDALRVKSRATAVKFARAVTKGPVCQQQCRRDPRPGDSVNMAEVHITMDLMFKYALLNKPFDLSGRLLTLP